MARQKRSQWKRFSQTKLLKNSTLHTPKTKEGKGYFCARNRHFYYLLFFPGTKASSTRIRFCLKTLLSPIRLPSTRIRLKRSPKTQHFENALQVGISCKRRFRDRENGTFRKRWRISIGASLPAPKKWREIVSLLFALHKAAMKYTIMPKARTKLLYLLFLLEIYTAQQTYGKCRSLAQPCHFESGDGPGNEFGFGRTS